MGERLGDVHGFHLADENLGVFRHVHAGHGGDHRGRLADDFGVQGAVDQDGGADFVQLVRLQEVAASAAGILPLPLRIPVPGQ